MDGKPPCDSQAQTTPNRPLDRKATPKTDFLSPPGLLSPHLPKMDFNIPGSAQSSSKARFSHSCTLSARSPLQKSPEIIKIKDLAMQGKPLPIFSDQDYNRVITLLSSERKDAANDHNYPLCKKLTFALNHIISGQLSHQKQLACDIETERVMRSDETFQQKLKEFDAETQAQEKELQKRIDEQRQNMLQSFSQQYADFDVHWKSPAKYRLYTISSNVLTTLEHNLNFLLAQCRFDEAEDLQKVVNQQIEAEQVKNHENMQSDYEIAYNMLKEKQANEKDFFEDNAGLELAKFAQKRARMRLAYENEEKKHSAAKELVSNPEKLWNRAQAKKIAECTLTVKTSSNERPSLKMTRNDIRASDVIRLTLPPLEPP